MIVNKKINITPIKSMFNSILLGNEVELDIISNFTIPYTSDTILKVFKKYNTYSINYERMFHFLTFFRLLLYRVAPITNNNFITFIKIKEVISLEGNLTVNIEYEIE